MGRGNEHRDIFLFLSHVFFLHILCCYSLLLLFLHQFVGRDLVWSGVDKQEHRDDRSSHKTECYTTIDATQENYQLIFKKTR